MRSCCFSLLYQFVLRTLYALCIIYHLYFIPILRYNIVYECHITIKRLFTYLLNFKDTDSRKLIIAKLIIGPKYFINC